MKRVVRYGHPALTQESAPINIFDSSLKELADEMYQIMLASKGIGLAAPQVGLNIALIVVDTQEEKGIGRLDLVNPTITVSSEEKIEMMEGCLSFPQIYLPVRRPVTIRVKAHKVNGKEFSFTATGLLARVIQHEIDHLKGTLFIDLVENKKALDEAQESIQSIREAEHTLAEV